MGAPAASTPKTNLVSKFFTPLATLLVVSGIVLAWPDSPIRECLFGLVVLTFFFNYWTSRWIDASPAPWKLTLRMDVNLLINISLVYFLFAKWPPIWLLLYLSPLASALYGAQSKVIGQSFLAAAVLLVVHHLQGSGDPMAWAQTIAYAMSLILLSLAVYELARVAKEQAVERAKKGS